MKNGHLVVRGKRIDGTRLADIPTSEWADWVEAMWKAIDEQLPKDAGEHVAKIFSEELAQEFQQKGDEYAELLQKEHRLEKLEGYKKQLLIEGELLVEFKTNYHGWESDQYGWLIQGSAGTKHVILTNHGRPYLGTFQELLDLKQELQRQVIAIDVALTELRG